MLVAPSLLQESFKLLSLNEFQICELIRYHIHGVMKQLVPDIKTNSNIMIKSDIFGARTYDLEDEPPHQVMNHNPLV